MTTAALALLLAPVMAGAQTTPAPKPAAKPVPMTHDMRQMGADTAMKHDMSAMRADMMKGGMMQGGMKSGWGELDAFHSLLMATWHPAEKDSLALARSLAATLGAAGDAWAKSKGPKACDNAAMRQALPDIVASTKAFASVAAKAAKDAEVKAALKRVHDGFEKAAMPCIMNSMDHAAMHQGMSAKKP